MEALPVRKIETIISFPSTKKVIKQSVQRLTEAGENYGSLMLKVDLTIESNLGPEEVRIVAKLLPPNKFMQEVFNIDVTFPKEVSFYKKIIPLLREFQRSHGIKDVINFIPKYYGSRLNLIDENNKPDSDAVLLLENLKVKNYFVLDRCEGLDLDVARSILTNLAHLHGVALAVKLKSPKVFETEIKPFLVPWKLIPEHYNKLRNDIINLIDHTEKLQPFKERIVLEFEQQMVWKEACEHFATIVHNDCWTNNFLIKFEHEKIMSKIVDYQMYSYGSPAKDVIFFLFSSVKPEVLVKYYDNLVEFYHSVLVSVLKQLNCSTDKFGFEDFLKEMDYEGRNSQFAHVAFMLFVILAPKEKVKEVSEMNAENLVSEEIGELLKKRFLFFVHEFEKRKWIYNN